MWVLHTHMYITEDKAFLSLLMVTSFGLMGLSKAVTSQRKASIMVSFRSSCSAEENAP
jgi:hypothetical protein